MQDFAVSISISGSHTSVCVRVLEGDEVGLVKGRFLGVLPNVSDLVLLGWELRICISTKVMVLVRDNPLKQLICVLSNFVYIS